MIRQTLLTITAILAAALTTASCGLEQEDAARDLGPLAVQAAFADNRLWVRDHDGQLWSIAPSQSSAIRLAAPGGEHVVGLCVQDDRLIVATGLRPKLERVSLRGRDGDGWSTLAAIQTPDEGFIGLGCGVSGPVALTTRRLVTIDQGAAKNTPLSRPFVLDGPPVANLRLTDRQIFVGLDIGEWGGGLRRIDRTTGEMLDLHDTRGEDSCGEPLDSACDPVVGVVPAPWAPGCMIAAIGLAHMRERGRVVTVCDGRITRWFTSRRCTPLAKDCTEALRAIVADGDRPVVISDHGVTQLTADGLSARRSLPQFQAHGPFDVSFADSRFVVVGRAARNGRPTWVQAVASRAP